MADSIVAQLNDGNIAGAVPDQIAPQGKLAQQVSDNPKRIREFLSELFGIKDAVRAYKGEMTEDEAQNFALTAALGVVPMAGEAAPAVRAVEDVAPEAAQSIVKMIRAYHGSPYDFDKFDLSKIGTGEGAQAYGHGLYFAENPAVAESYKNDPAMISFTRGKDWTDDQEEAFKWLHENGYDTAKASADIAKRISQAKMYADSAESTASLNQVKAIIDSGWNPPRGRMYEVNIAADPEHFLDWDKPLSEQPQNVKDIFAASGVHSSYAGPMGTRIESNAPLGELAKGRLQQGDSLLMQNLRQAGIPGIKYLDQGSRAGTITPAYRVYSEGDKFYASKGAQPRAGGPFGSEAEANKWVSNQGTHNYVVFDDKLIDIVKKYGLAGLIAAGATNFTPKKK